MSYYYFCFIGHKNVRFFLCSSQNSSPTFRKVDTVIIICYVLEENARRRTTSVCYFYDKIKMHFYLRTHPLSTQIHPGIIHNKVIQQTLIQRGKSLIAVPRITTSLQHFTKMHLSSFFSSRLLDFVDSFIRYQYFVEVH